MLILKGEITWEPRECFVDDDNTENDIFQDYNKAHPIKQRKRKNSDSQPPALGKKARTTKKNTNNTQ